MKENGTEVLGLLESTSEEKDLGIWIDDKLKFTNHIGHVVSKSRLTSYWVLLNVPSYIEILRL